MQPGWRAHHNTRAPIISPAMSQLETPITTHPSCHNAGAATCQSTFLETRVYQRRENAAMPGRIGFIGVGQMGQPMARNLLKSGFELCVYDLHPVEHGSRCART
jgi:hypothetical protein